MVVKWLCNFFPTPFGFPYAMQTLATPMLHWYFGITNSVLLVKYFCYQFGW